LKELYDIMAVENATEGAIFTTGTFTQQAREWAEGKPLQLSDGAQILDMIHNSGSRKLIDLLNKLNAQSEDKVAHR